MRPFLLSGRVILFKNDVAATRFVLYLEPQTITSSDQWARSLGFAGNNFLPGSPSTHRNPGFGPETGVVYMGSLE
ncbi:MAG: hypothetical protein H7Y86_01130 [Rhizobacter sp.]|nr:hypothetical protein [Ferruginibacter sp.]